MEKKHARTSMVAAVTSLPGVCFFIFHYESGLVLKIVFENVFFGRLFPHFFSFFIFEHFSQKKWKKNTRTSMVAAVTSSPRVRFFIFHYESGLVLKTVFDKKKLVRISPVFSSFFPIPHPRSSPFSLRVQNGKTALMEASGRGHTAIVKLLQ